MSDDVPIRVQTYGAELRVSRQVALDLGWVEPTPEEAAEMQRWREEYDRREAERNRIVDEARETLAALTDPLTRAILDLHTEDDQHNCEGCDNDGWDEEPRIWPCLTVRGIARFYGIPLLGDVP